jgi:hypothetical protein
MLPWTKQRSSRLFGCAGRIRLCQGFRLRQDFGTIPQWRDRQAKHPRRDLETSAKEAPTARLPVAGFKIPREHAGEPPALRSSTGFCRDFKKGSNHPDRCRFVRALRVGTTRAPYECIRERVETSTQFNQSSTIFNEVQ